VAQVVSWGGTTKEYDVEADLHKLDAYNITLQQMISALGNANINVGGRTINLGQQSVNIRGVGLIEDTKDIEQVVLTQHNGVPCRSRTSPRSRSASRRAWDAPGVTTRTMWSLPSS
jgi:cobalt-zinc-cadmium resistance protein CzcA